MIKPTVDLKYTDPLRTPVFTNPGETLSVQITSAQIGTESDSLSLFADGSVLTSTTAETLNFDFIADNFTMGPHSLAAIARDTGGLADTLKFYVMVNPAVENLPRPAGIRDGINYINATTVTLSLFAPYKNFVYVIGDFNDWKVNTNYYMKREEVDADSVHWWITLTGIIPGNEYAFQYLVDGSLRIADPYTEKILDPWNDQYISSTTYPDLKPYPAGKTGEAVGIMETGLPAFNWQYSAEYRRPPQQDLVIYELLLRDFLHAHDFKTLRDTLNYLADLGINAIELMPVNEFEGNSSWGYNPSFYFAVDKYYGPANDLKKFIDECHRRGIAVIIDMVLNHSFGQSPFVRLYWDAANNRPAANNPWYNPIPRHPYNVGYDFNHASPATQALVDRINAFWLTQYKVDGFRYDLSKGFTQQYTTDVGVWSAYDASRIAILKRMADKVWLVDSTAYVILEHFAANSEETELANDGMLLWGNLNYNYNEATMGYHKTDNGAYGQSDFSWGYYKNRGWSKPGLITYMESHDEERLMYKNLAYGNACGNYSIKNLETALNRIKMAAAFFLTLPGPKMIWKFGELGYDYSIEYNGRLAEKPIRWDYFQNPLRSKLYRTLAALMHLRNEQEIFRSTATIVDQQVLYEVKKIRLSHPTMNAVIVGNFDVTGKSIDPDFHHGGYWYDFFSGDSLLVINNNTPLNLLAGEFHIYTDKKLPAPEPDILNYLNDESGKIAADFVLDQNFPNPFNPSTTITFYLPVKSWVSLDIYDLLGRKVSTLIENKQLIGSYSVAWDGRDRQGRMLSSGVYFYKIRARDKQKIIFEQSRKMVLLK